ncbi:hypothetical protein H4P12_15350 [Paracoccus sp. 11-3]|uniref:Uncharacterized protein n=1 Tax=Paracoccus amoyensis TaxID=2760093 RepID=A0A926G8Y9_9RHOB|nr:hypothetical protein [Paracoccus amoyensis]
MPDFSFSCSEKLAKTILVARRSGLPCVVLGIPLIGAQRGERSTRLSFTCQPSTACVDLATELQSGGRRSAILPGQLDHVRAPLRQFALRRTMLAKHVASPTLGNAHPTFAVERGQVAPSTAHCFRLR